MGNASGKLELFQGGGCRCSRFRVGNSPGIGHRLRLFVVSRAVSGSISTIQAPVQRAKEGVELPWDWFEARDLLV